MRLRQLLLVLLTIPLLFSCSNDGSYSELTRRWVSESDTNQYITFTYSDGTGSFERLSDAGVEKGSWTMTGDSLILTLVPNQTIGVDSILMSTDAGSVTLDMQQNGESVSTLVDGELNVATVDEIYTIKIEGRTLLLNGTTNLDYIYPELEKSGFSVLAILRGLLGLIVLLGIAWLCSANRKAISWSLVGKGLLIQLVLALGVLKIPFIESMFESVGWVFIKIIGFTQEGTDFLFSSFISGEIESSLINFVVMVLPTIIFFAALTSLFYYWGILQRIVFAFAWVMKRIMKLSGAESLAAAGNIFLGQTESPLLIRPYLDKMTKSEIMCLMTGGMATIAGGVLAAYIGFLGGGDPVQELFFAKHLLAASVMSAPAAIVAAKMLVPETEDYNEDLKVPKDKLGSNALEAIANGTTEGLKLAVNVGAMLLVFTALIAMGNWILDLIGGWTGLNGMIASNTDYNGLSMQFIIGYAFAPIAWTLGVPAADMVLVGQLLGEKTILNEFYAYVTLGDMKNDLRFTSEKSVIMATYILCGFANFASIGIQIGGIGALVPNRKGLLSKLGFRALIGGTLACLFTAVMVGMLL